MLEQDDKYKNKYLKYKLKYINLKKIMYGAAAEYYFRYRPSKAIQTEIDPSDFINALFKLGVITTKEGLDYITNLDKVFNMFDKYKGTDDNKVKVKIFKKICQEIAKHNAKITQKLGKDKDKDKKSKKVKELEAKIDEIRKEGSKKLAEIDRIYSRQGFPDVLNDQIPLEPDHRAKYNKVYNLMEEEVEKIKKQIEKEKYTNEESFYTHKQIIDYNFITIANAIINKNIMNESNAFDIFKDYASQIYVKEQYEMYENNDKYRIDLIKTNINKFKNDMIKEILDNINNLNIKKGQFIENIDDPRMPKESKQFLEEFKTLYPLQEEIQKNKPTFDNSTYTFNSALMDKFKSLDKKIESINKTLFPTSGSILQAIRMHNILTQDQIIFFLYLKELKQYISKLYSGELYYTLMIEGGLDNSKDKYEKYDDENKEESSFHERLISCIMRLLNTVKPVEYDIVIKQYLEQTKTEYFKYPSTTGGSNIITNTKCKL
jgi:hypothetical protein